MRALPGRETRITPEVPPAVVTRASAHADQRRRIIRAVGELVAQDGYGELHVNAIFRRAGISATTFYKHFAGKRESFVALYEDVFASTTAAIEKCLEAEARPWAERVALALRGYLDAIVSDPTIARAVIVETSSAGVELRRRYEHDTKAFVPLFLEGRQQRSARGPGLPETVEETLSGSVFWAAHQRLIVDDVDALPGLLPDLIELVLRTYLGAEEAERLVRTERATFSRPHEAAGKGARGSISSSQDRKLPPAAEGCGDRRAAASGELGRHQSFAPEQIFDPQSESLLAAVTAEVIAHGYLEMKITDIAERASVSTGDFYDRFEGKEASFIAAFDFVFEHLQRLVARAAGPEPDWPRRVIAGLRAALEFCASEPELARFCLLESVSATPTISRRFSEAVHVATPALAAGRATLGDRPELPRSLEGSLLGGVLSLARRRILAEETETLPALLADLVEFVLSPYLGAERAAEWAAGTRAAA